LNDKYRRKFHFPFIMAVKGKGRAQILAAFERRLNNSVQIEFEEALDQIAEIARLRLADLIRS
jgi:2-oxo-4-hydroxy-4-carboxy--5-ureidoimidazoline (OHCU) decarboxylase